MSCGPEAKRSRTRARVDLCSLGPVVQTESYCLSRGWDARLGKAQLQTQLPSWDSLLRARAGEGVRRCPSRQQDTQMKYTASPAGSILCRCTPARSWPIRTQARDKREPACGFTRTLWLNSPRPGLRPRLAFRTGILCSRLEGTTPHTANTTETKNIRGLRIARSSGPSGA